MFIITLRYKVSLEKITEYREKHLLYLDLFYKSGNLIMSGRQNPPNGGVIIANFDSINEVDDFVANDPFCIQGLAEYDIINFMPTKIIKENIKN